MTADMHARDLELLRRTREGDAQAFGAFYGEHHPAVLAFLRPRVANAELAADLMCETFTKALVAVHDPARDLPVVPIAWLLTIARNEHIDAVRRGAVADRTRRRLAMEPLLLADSDISAIENAAADAAVIEELESILPADQFEAFSARVLNDRGYDEIARQLECSPSVVRKRVSRAVALLRSTRLETS